MFALIESHPAQRPPSGWSARAASGFVHLVIVALAVTATRRTPAAPPEHVDVYDLNWSAPQASSAPAPSSASAAPSLPSFTIPRVIPPVIVGDVPLPSGVIGALPVDSGALVVFDSGLGSGRPQPIGEAPRDVRYVDDPPVLLSHPPIRYPETMRQAGVEGRVVVETVLDSLGRAESSLTHVTRGAGELFDREATAVVLASRYQPARMNGRAVRVRILVPVNFVLR